MVMEPNLLKDASSNKGVQVDIWAQRLSAAPI